MTECVLMSVVSIGSFYLSFYLSLLQKLNTSGFVKDASQRDWRFSAFQHLKSLKSLIVVSQALAFSKFFGIGLSVQLFKCPRKTEPA